MYVHRITMDDLILYVLIYTAAIHLYNLDFRFLLIKMNEYTQR